MKYIFLAGGRTGGPIIPLISISEYLTEYTPVIIGIKHSFEQKYAMEHNISFISLFESKSRAHSFKNTNILYKILGFGQNLFSIVLLVVNCVIILSKLISYKPSAILSAGGFTAVPTIFASVFTNFLRITRSKIIIHQQDPEVGITNKLTAHFAHYHTCVFEITKKHPLFANAEVIFNPLYLKKYDEINEVRSDNHSKLTTFISAATHPVLLVFGGGSGAQAINNWVFTNISILTQRFSIIHLTGSLQIEKSQIIEHPNYLSFTALYDEMPTALRRANLVICRAGLGSISELLYLQKPAFLVPLPNTHQQTNAHEVNSSFEVLYQENINDWVDIIDTKFPDNFKNKSYPDPIQVQQGIYNYIDTLRKLLDN
jgi:UDP-N-acetylglucosamine--N-acetylmuramyl-(pentapeptide) pyrophosphoryl-undecaprenol N-acetylglucosamine transferase